MHGFVPVRITALEWEVRRKRVAPASCASVEPGRSLVDERDMTQAKLIFTALINGNSALDAKRITLDAVIGGL